MSFLPLTIRPGEDLRVVLEELGSQRQGRAFVVSAVGNLSLATLRLPGRRNPEMLRGEHEIISLTGSLDSSGVHLHLSLAGRDGRVIGGHLERGNAVHTGAELLLASLDSGEGTPQPIDRSAADLMPPLEIAVLPGCPYSARAIRLLRTLSIPHQITTVRTDAERSAVEARCGSRSLPQVFIGGEAIGGYDALAERHGSGQLEGLRAASL